MSLGTYRIALVGLGKIARDQHIPCIRGNPRFALAATASTSGASVEGVPAFKSLGEILAQSPGIEAVALLTPPEVRTALALEAIAAGKHVLLEKPPPAPWPISTRCASGRQARRHALRHLALALQRRRGRGAPQARWPAAGGAHHHLEGGCPRWHPGQEWIWTEQGFGVLDPASTPSRSPPRSSTRRSRRGRGTVLAAEPRLAHRRRDPLRERSPSGRGAGARRWTGGRRATRPGPSRSRRPTASRWR